MQPQYIKKEKYIIFQKARTLALNYEAWKAISVIDHYLKQAPDDSDMLVLKGNILEMTDSGGDAEVIYKKVLSIDPNNCKALIDIGDICNANNDYLCAINYYSRALETLKKISKNNELSSWSKEDLELSGFRGKIKALLALEDGIAIKKTLKKALALYANDDFLINVAILINNQGV